MICWIMKKKNKNIQLETKKRLWLVNHQEEYEKISNAGLDEKGV